MKAVNKMKEFAEVCEFVYIPRDEETRKLAASKKETFTGDFIDAIIYIKRKLKTEYGNFS
jgi:hypothetical protein